MQTVSQVLVHIVNSSRSTIDSILVQNESIKYTVHRVLAILEETPFRVTYSATACRILLKIVDAVIRINLKLVG
jgi:hypothetical protein